MGSIPDMTMDRERLNQIDGSMPRLNAIPEGLRVSTRVARAPSHAACVKERPVPDRMPARRMRRAGCTMRPIRTRGRDELAAQHQRALAAGAARRARRFAGHRGRAMKELTPPLVIATDLAKTFDVSAHRG